MWQALVFRSRQAEQYLPNVQDEASCAATNARLLASTQLTFADTNRLEIGKT